MRLLAGLTLLLFCLGWTVWWGLLLARRRRWVPAALLWLAAAVLVVEVAFVPIAHQAARRPATPR